MPTKHRSLNEQRLRAKIIYRHCGIDRLSAIIDPAVLTSRVFYCPEMIFAGRHGKDWRKVRM